MIYHSPGGFRYLIFNQIDMVESAKLISIHFIRNERYESSIYKINVLVQYRIKWPIGAHQADNFTVIDKPHNI